MKTTNHTLAGLRTVAIVLASLFASMAAQAGSGTDATARTMLGTNAVALGQKSTAIGKNALAVGNGASEQDVRALIDKSRGIQDSINTLQAAIDRDTTRYGASLETMERVERNKKRIDELSSALAENQTLLREKQALFEKQTHDYNRQKDIVEQKANILTSLSTGEFVKAWESGGMDELARVTKEKVEEGTSINNSIDFYKDYVKNFVDSSTTAKGVDKALEKNGLIPRGSVSPGDALMKNIGIDPGNYYDRDNGKSFLAYSASDSVETLQKRLSQAESFLPNIGQYATDTINNLKEKLIPQVTAEKAVQDALHSELDKGIYSDMIKKNYEAVTQMAVSDINYLIQLKKVNSMSKSEPEYPAEFKKLINLEKIKNDNNKNNRRDENRGLSLWLKDKSFDRELKNNLVESVNKRNKENSEKILSGLNATLNETKKKADEASHAVSATDKDIKALQTTIDTLTPGDDELKEYDRAKVLKKAIDDNSEKINAGSAKLAELQKNMNNGTGATAVGAGSIAIGKNSVALGADTVASRENSVDVGNRQITSVADGTEKHDAVNKGQLDTEANARIEGDKLALTHANNYTDGREKAINTRTDGLIKTEQNARIEGDKQTLTSANAYTDGREKVINSRTDGLIKREQTDRSAAIKAEAAARVQGDTQTLAAAKAHSDAGDVKTLNSANSYTDASSKSTLKKANNYTDNRFEHFGTQISNDVLEKSYSYTERRSVAAENNAVRRANTYTDSKFGQLNTKIEQAEKRFNAGIAGVTAIASIPYVAENTFSYGLAVGNYRNGNALAGGVQYKTSPNTNVRLNVSWDSSGNAALGAGLAGGW
ncbi:hypothetical protein BZH87_21130 [Salmonella enterica]|nr:hypothetical protein [Salmonella enterica]EBA6489662.1 hypothetical protein [Salmonella enterica]EBD2348585.1 hypothetical protein [Salmonella enterica]EBE8491388.1 hypothetical protein [Salmonella enterica]ECE5263122.1 hypothetical protein [Salmonella enterica]